MANVENEAEFKPRDYQIKLYEAAKRENTIVCLGTGTGKTFIAILLMKDPEFHGQLLGNYNSGAKRTVFLAPTKPLVKQQAAEIGRHWPDVKGRVGEYTGDKNVDQWSKEKWVEEFAKHQVLVMVPQILLDIINHGFINFSKINLLIIDEAHWAAKKKGNKESGHPVKQIMNIYKKSLNKPRILALTASLINRALKATDFDEAINDIKATYMAVCNTSNVAELCGTNPEELVWSYNSLGSSPSPCAKSVIPALQIFIDNIKIKIKENNSQDSMPLGLERIKKCFVNIKNMLTDSSDSINPQNENPTAMSWMGIWCAKVATDLYIEEFQESIELYQNLNPSYAEILRNIFMFLTLIRESFKPDLADRMSAYTTASEKMHRLLELLSQYNPSNGQTSELCGIVFVNQRSVAKVLTDWINEMKELFPQKYGFLKVDWVVGHSSKPGFETLVASYSNKKQQKTIHDFREKDLNLLISTAVLEEGLDVRQCNVVVRYDKPLTFRQYLQSKGRARANGARYYMITSSEDSEKLRLELINYRIMEEKIKNLNQISSTDFVANDCDDEEEEFMTKSGGARITTKTSIALLYRYCQKLTADSFTKLEPSFELITPAFDFLYTTNPQYRYSVRLPVNCPIKEKINGDIRGSSSKAKRNAAFYACKALYECEELDENFLPVSKEMFIEKYISDLSLKHYKDSNSGNRNSQKIYPKGLAQVFSKPDFTTNKYYLHSIAINHPLIESSNVITFGAITSSPITNSCKFTVFVKTGKTGVHFSSLKTILLKAQELDSIKKFHCFTFNNALQIENNGIIYSQTESKFDLLLVPLKNQDIDWLFVKLIENQKPFEVKLESVSERLGFKYNPDLYKDTVVYPLYRTEEKFGFYKVLETTELTPKSIFTESKKSKTFEQFYREKYSLEICDKKQNLFEAKLVDKFAQIKTFFVKQKTAKNLEKRQFFVPELMAIHPFPNSLWKQALCLPSIIYRLNHLFLAEELRLLIHSETFPRIGNLNPLNKMLKLDVDYDLEKSDENVNEIGLKRIHSDDENDTECDGHPFGFDSNDNEININVKPLRKRPKNVNSDIKVIKDPKKSIQSPLNTSNYNITSVVRIGSNSENELLCISKQLIKQFNQLLINNNCVTTDFNINEIVYDQIEYEQQMAIVDNRPPSYGEAFPFIFDGDINDYIPEKYDQNVYDPIVGPTADLLLNALTLLNANDSINLERLETIGDSFLKFITTANLYYCCPELDEGRLTYLRSIQICNCNLFHIGIEKNLSQLLVATKFYPNLNWLPPRYETTDENEGLLMSQDKLAHCHQLISDKSIADSIEALIGAHLLSGGNKSALIFMQWLGLRVSKNELDFNNSENKSPNEIWTWLPKPTSPVFSHIDKNESIRAVDNLYRNCNLSQFEKMIGYEFRDKAYLIQALTHSSYYSNNITDCYQRLEFLGDAVLDYLITRNIFRNPTKFSPGEITDLRSALVNNSFFASIAVKYSYHKYMKLFSIDLYRAIEHFVKKFESEKTKTIENCFNCLTDEEVEDLEEVEVPKALGDVFESVAGAIFLDSGLSLDTVWNIYYKMIKPEIDYFSENVPKMPVRELRELCESKNRKIEFSAAKIISSRKISMTITISGKEYTGFGINKNFAKIAASKSALKALKKTKK